MSGSPQDLHESSTGFPHAAHQAGPRAAIGGPCRTIRGTRMTVIVRAVVAAMLVSALWSRADAASDATLFRVFFMDGSSVVTYGELARVEDQVIFSMPVGGSEDQPRLHPVTLPARLVDWERTDRYAASTRF